MENHFVFPVAFDQHVAQNTTWSLQQPQQCSIGQRPRSTSASSTSSSSSYGSFSSRRSLSPSRAGLSEKNTTIGSIVFLPWDENTKIHCAQSGCGKKIHIGALEHPAVVLKMWKSMGGEVMTLACTMSGNRNPCPEENARNLPVAREPKTRSTIRSSNYLPEEVMYLETPGTLKKQSYIQVKHVYAIPLSKLQPFSNGRLDNRLSQESYSYLMGVLGQEEAPWTPTAFLESLMQSATQNAGAQEFALTQKDIDPMNAVMNGTEHAFSALSITLNSIESSTSEEDSSDVICDGCDQCIFGDSYKSPNLPNVDYCSACIPCARYLHPGHKFVLSSQLHTEQLDTSRDLLIQKILVRLAKRSQRLTS
ncbi:hypothetical protein VTL71DRAFT_65 [Oculimacula yallundae]|uniref:ZZ-type domain-containing protein n=1 Tax=Oculimacula yallundae TaxID=86028 RepID=A0ABR4CYY4_9HELO